MERNLVYDINNYYNSLNQQMLMMQATRQSLQQIQDLANLIKILGNALSFAENYAIMNGYKNEKTEFTYYDYFNASKNTEKNLYFKKLNAAIYNLDNAYEYYVSVHHSEPLPESLKKEEIIERLELYKKYLKPEEQKTYNDFINVFYRNSIKNVKNAINNFKGDGTMEQKKIIETFLSAAEIAREDNENAKDKYTKNPDYKPDIKLNKDKPCIGSNYGPKKPRKKSK